MGPKNRALIGIPSVGRPFVSLSRAGTALGP